LSQEPPAEPAPAAPQAPAPWRARAGRRAGPAADLACVIALLWAGLSLWPMGELVGAPPLPEGLPGWASLQDLMLSGPDAGEWASTATAFHLGEYGELGHHRMPTWPILTGLMMHLQPDVALAGHLLNHLALLALPILVYTVARSGSGRGIALAAGLIIACCPPLVENGRRLTSDIWVSTLLLAGAASALAAARRWWLAPLAGVVAALLACVHYTAMAYPLPLLLLLIVAGRGRWWQRLLAPTLFLAVGGGLAWSIFQVFPLPTSTGLSNAMGEALVRGSQDTGAGNTADLAALLGGVTPAKLAAAVNLGITRVMEWLVPPWMPWGAALIFPWLGLVGALGPRLYQGPRAALGALGRGLAAGVPLLLCLGPLPVVALMEAGASDRYMQLSIPMAAVLFARGLALPVDAAERGLARLWARWPVGLIGLGLGLSIGGARWAASADWVKPLPPRMEDIAAWKLGRAIAAEFPPGGDAACLLREANVHAGRGYCPQTACPFGTGTSAFNFCLGVMNGECDGEGDLPYVVTVRHNDERTAARAAMDEWVMARWPPVQHLEEDLLEAWVVRIPREELPEVKGPSER
jgi:hypothetical protein